MRYGTWRVFVLMSRFRLVVALFLHLGQLSKRLLPQKAQSFKGVGADSTSTATWERRVHTVHADGPRRSADVAAGWLERWILSAWRGAVIHRTTIGVLEFTAKHAIALRHRAAAPCNARGLVRTS